DYEYDHPGEDTLSPGWIEPHQHPENPDARGPIEPRHFEIMSSKDLSSFIEEPLQHKNEFYVDASGVYVGAYPNGIHKWIRLQKSLSRWRTTLMTTSGMLVADFARFTSLATLISMEVF
ncbi:MAG: hypothetical protein ACXACD_16800, partial [Candidatus Thorarchaeota archaeon]